MMGKEPAPLGRPTRGLRRRVRHDLTALGGVLLGYMLLAYVAVPAWWRHHTSGVDLADEPTVTHTRDGIPGDPVNVALVGTRAEVVHALVAAGWYPADPTTLRSSLRIGKSVLFRRPYVTAPVSNLYLLGRRQDLAFELPEGKSPKDRHHVRFWRSQTVDDQDRPYWLGAATYDLDVGLSHRTGQITHHIGADVDAERDKLIANLQRAGQLTAVWRVPGVGPTSHGRNGGGDLYHTDGYRVVGVLIPGSTLLAPGQSQAAGPASCYRMRRDRARLAGCGLGSLCEHISRRAFMACSAVCHGPRPCSSAGGRPLAFSRMVQPTPSGRTS